jgi:Zn-dependent protease with chaperone function
MTATRRTIHVTAAITALAMAVAGAQTKITPPKNRYTPQQDVELGREAAAEVRKELPVITDPELSNYLDRLGKQLVAAAPAELNQPAFQYSFTPVNLKDINAFALPGGPMFVNRGMFEAARGEGEVVGVMAHELSHVLLRHGTANATKAQGFQLGALAGAIAGAVVGGGWGQLISQGSQFGLGTWLLKYSREYEKQADLLGAQIMARAGYDPRDLGRMFETIQKQAGNGAPQWMSSHPDPGNRSAYIAKEAANLRVESRPNTTAAFEMARSRFASLPAAQSMAEVAKRSEGRGGNTGNTGASSGRIGDAVARPATQYRTAQGGRLFEVQVPVNWQSVSSNNSMKFVPQNGYGDYRGETVFTHGTEIGVSPASSDNLMDATMTLVEAFRRANPNLRTQGTPREVRLSGRPGLAVPMVNSSAVGGQEYVGLHTTFLRDGNLLYVATIVPQNESSAYQPAFSRVLRSLRLKD